MDEAVRDLAVQSSPPMRGHPPSEGGLYVLGVVLLQLGRIIALVGEFCRDTISI